MKNNGLSNSTIYSGQVLDTTTTTTTTYKVVSGDSLYLIAKKHNITLDKLRSVNDKWNDTIYPGNMLKISSTPSSGQVTQGTPGVIKHSISDVDLLARLITAEANGEGPDAMLAVGAVVVNRAQSSKFPNSINEVINEKSNGHYQFTPVLNGMINKVATKSAINAASQALKGTDPTNGALYFFDDTVTNEWLTSKKVATSVGNLTFAY